MARSVPLVSTIFVLLLLLAATEMGPMAAEARMCKSESRRSPVPCMKKSCDFTCRSEGFPDGYCRGLSRCVCRKAC